MSTSHPDPSPFAVLEPDPTCRASHSMSSLCNFRDLGGLPLRGGGSTLPGRLFRADGLHLASDDDLRRLDDLGIRLVVDLRTERECRSEGRFSSRYTGIDYHHVPLMDENLVMPGEGDDPYDLLVGLLDAIVETRTRQIADVLTSVALVGAPAVFHCTAGRDRTGVVAALALAVAGVTDEAIGGDFALSNAAIPCLTRRYRHQDEGTATSGAPAIPLPVGRALVALPARAESILCVLGSIRDRHGSVVDYLGGAGVTSDALGALRYALIGSVT